MDYWPGIPCELNRQQGQGLLRRATSTYTPPTGSSGQRWKLGSQNSSQVGALRMQKPKGDAIHLGQDYDQLVQRNPSRLTSYLWQPKGPMRVSLSHVTLLGQKTPRAGDIPVPSVLSAALPGSRLAYENRCVQWVCLSPRTHTQLCLFLSLNRKKESGSIMPCSG